MELHPQVRSQIAFRQDLRRAQVESAQVESAQGPGPAEGEFGSEVENGGDLGGGRTPQFHKQSFPYWELLGKDFFVPKLPLGGLGALSLPKRRLARPGWPVAMGDDRAR